MNIEKLTKLVKLTKHTHVVDSDKLKQMAYKFAQMANYFDRGDSINSRKILAKEDDRNYADFYNYGLQVLAQLKFETKQLQEKVVPEKYRKSSENETIALLEDGSAILYNVAEEHNDKKGEILSKELTKFTGKYKYYIFIKPNLSYDSLKKDAKTAQGYEVVKLVKSKSGRLYCIMNRKVDYAIGAGYNQQRGDWDQGYYGYSSEDAALKALPGVMKRAGEIMDAVKDEVVSYKGYKIEKFKYLSDEEVGYPYAITKNGIIQSGANSIDEAKKIIDKLVAAKDAVKDEEEIIVAVAISGNGIKEFKNKESYYKFAQLPQSNNYQAYLVPKKEYASLKALRNANFAFNRLHGDRKTRRFDSVKDSPQYYTVMFFHKGDTYTGLISGNDENEVRTKFATYCPSCKIDRVKKGILGYEYPIITRGYEESMGWR